MQRIDIPNAIDAAQENGVCRSLPVSTKSRLAAVTQPTHLPRRSMQLRPLICNIVYILAAVIRSRRRNNAARANVCASGEATFKGIRLRSIFELLGWNKKLICGARNNFFFHKRKLFGVREIKVLLDRNELCVYIIMNYVFGVFTNRDIISSSSCLPRHLALLRVGAKILRKTTNLS